MTAPRVAADLAADTAARADGDRAGRYHFALPTHWDFALPSGGVVMTCALRAAQAELGDPRLSLASATAMFATPIHPGALVADVTVIRRGGATAQIRTSLRDGGGGGTDADGSEAGGKRGIVEVTSTWCRDRRGPDVVCATPPPVRAVADALAAADDSPANPHTRFAFFQQLECRIADGDASWRDGWSAGPAHYARWFRYRHPQRDAHGRLDRLALPPLVDTMPAALARAIGPGDYRFFAPSLDLTLHTVDDTTREWLLVAVRCRRARMGWAIGDAEVWDDEGRLIAHGSQAMYIHGLAGEPPIVDASRR